MTEEVASVVESLVLLAAESVGQLRLELLEAAGFIEAYADEFQSMLDHKESSLCC